MGIFQITKKTRMNFHNMDPWGYLERLELSSYFALGVMRESKKTKKDVAVGLVLCKLQNDGVMIEWLYVEQEYRMQGVGEELLMCLYEMSAKKGYQNLYVCFHNENGREEVYAYEQKYFAERFFEEMPSYVADVRTNLQTLESMSYFKEKAEIKHKIYPLYSIDPEKLKQDIKILAEKKEAMSLYPVDDKIGLFDPDISVLMYEGERVCGAVLYQCIGNVTIYPIYFYFEMKEDEKNLLYGTFLLALKKYKKDMEVRLLIRSEKGINFIESSTQKESVKSKIMVADVGAYVQQKQNEEMYQELISYID